jgi:hypothetical protein
MKSITILFLFFLLLSSCSPQRRLSRLLALHPELKTPDTLVIRDTIPIFLHETNNDNLAGLKIFIFIKNNSLYCPLILASKN